MPASCWETVSTKREWLSWARSAGAGCKDTLRLGTPGSSWSFAWGALIVMKADLY